MASSHEDDDRVYVDLVRPSGPDDGADTQAKPNATVTFRRTKGRDSLKRLSDILSAYIPVKPPPPPGGPASDNHQQREPLIEEETNAEGAAPASPGGRRGGGGGYRTLMLLNVPSLRLTDCNSRENLLLQDSLDSAAPSNSIDGDISGVALSKSGFAFLTFKDSPNLLRLEVNPLQPDASVAKSCQVIQLKLRGGVYLVPTDIKVFNEKLFACGHLSREVNGTRVELSAMVRCDLEGRVELASKELPNPRFYGFDIDPADGQLVVASPTPDGAAAQIFKMSEDFKRKLFKIQLGSRSHSWNRPEFVACLGGSEGGRCWVSVEQADSQSGLASGQGKNRLLSFPLRPPQQQQQQQQQQQEQVAGAEPPQQPSTKNWMKVSSWKFEGIKPGRLLTVPGARRSSPATTDQQSKETKEAADDDDEDRLLMLSKDLGNIYCVSESQGCSTLTHPSSEGGQAFTAFCWLRQADQQLSGSAAAHAGGVRPIDILAATKDSLYLLQAS